MLEYSVELTEDRDKLTLELGTIADLLRESNYFAGLEGSELIQRKHVDEAIKKRIYRSNLIEERVKEVMEKDIIWVETEGEKVGQVNGLAVLMTGDHVFGKPNRITATVSVGREGMVSIDRESKMSGATHTKGLMILSSLFRERFAHNKPIAFSASVCFEQSYGMIDGDSASSTEYYVLVSAISESALETGYRCNRIGQPEGRDPADRRRELQDQGLFRHLQSQRTHRRTGRHDSAQKHPQPDA